MWASSLSSSCKPGANLWGENRKLLTPALFTDHINKTVEAVLVADFVHRLYPVCSLIVNTVMHFFCSVQTQHKSQTAINQTTASAQLNFTKRKQNIYPKILPRAVSPPSIISPNVLQLWAAHLFLFVRRKHKQKTSLLCPNSLLVQFAFPRTDTGFPLWWAATSDWMNHHHLASPLPGVLSHSCHFCISKIWRIEFRACQWFHCFTAT